MYTSGVLGLDVKIKYMFEILKALKMANP